MSDMNQKTIKKDNRGGRREGAGRPAGSRDKIDRAAVREIIVKQSGQSYEELLIQDFLTARQNNGSLAQKYHVLIASKLIPTLNEVDVSESEDTVSAKQEAFRAALAAMITVQKD